jgi:hypothetical protein
MILHPSPTVIARYADRDAPLDEATAWTVEVHLEDCASCREVLAGVPAGDTRALLERVAVGLSEGIAAGPPPARRRRVRTVLHRWAVWQLVPWLGMSVAVLGCAVLLDRLALDLPSLVPLLAPVAPLPGVAVAWSRRADPAWELIAGTPTAGLAVLLRRTAAVLIVIVPALALLSGGTGVSLALMLLPCLAFTAAAVALGALVGVRRAAAGLAVGWALGVMLPAIHDAALPDLLRPQAVTGWALLTAVLAALAVARADSYRRTTGLS